MTRKTSPGATGPKSRADAVAASVEVFDDLVRARPLARRDDEVDVPAPETVERVVGSTCGVETHLPQPVSPGERRRLLLEACRRSPSLPFAGRRSGPAAPSWHRDARTTRSAFLQGRRRPSLPAPTACNRGEWWGLALRCGFAGRRGRFRGRSWISDRTVIAVARLSPRSVRAEACGHRRSGRALGGRGRSAAARDRTDRAGLVDGGSEHRSGRRWPFLARASDERSPLHLDPCLRASRRPSHR